MYFRYSRQAVVHLGPFFLPHSRKVSTLTPQQVTQVLSANEVHIKNEELPKSIEYIYVNQLASNSPIEDRIRVSTFQVPGCNEPSFLGAVFDGHGNGIVADIVSRRLFNYIALGLHPSKNNFKSYDVDQVRRTIVDLHTSPKPDRSDYFNNIETNELLRFKNTQATDLTVADLLKSSFKRCDDDLSQEIKENLIYSGAQRSIKQYYLSAAVSGCCAILMLIHEGSTFVASTGDCRAVFGRIISNNKVNKDDKHLKEQEVLYDDLNIEHNCDNLEELRRLELCHKSEQNTMVMHNRLLGNLMPFRAFGDFNYKWSIKDIQDCGLTKYFGLNIIPRNYKSPPYLIVEPDVNEMKTNQDTCDDIHQKKFIVLATDGLWELFGSSRDVIQAINEHEVGLPNDSIIDKNCATHILRSALKFGQHLEHRSIKEEELQQRYHMQLQSILTLPQAVVRNFRDDISLIVLKMR